MDDDFKISMDDIKDMVSELFGEKVQKVEAEDARKILKEDMEEFMSTGIDDISADRLTSEEETLLKEYENEHGEGSASAVPAEQRTDSVDVETLKKQAEEETRRKVEEEMREKIKKEMESERAKKKEKIMRKIEETKKQSEEYRKELSSKLPQGEECGLNYSERITVINMFDQSQKLFGNLLAKLIKRKPIDTMFLKTLEKSMEKYPDVLKKTDTNQYGKVRTDGTIEIARLASNINAMRVSENKKTTYFIAALRDIFEERLIAAELAVGIETKDDILSNLLTQAGKIFSKKNYAGRLIKIFNEKIVPDTTMKQGD